MADARERPIDALPEFETREIHVVFADKISAARAVTMLSVVCTRCRGGFLAVPRRWLEDKHVARPCPYCWRASRVGEPE